MLTLESLVTVPGLTGREVTDFLLDPDDDRYRAWWPGTHLELHPTRHGSRDDHVGDLLLMDEYVGSRRLRAYVEVLQAVPGERILWQVHRWGRRLPVRLSLALRTHEGDVTLRHTITAGWPGRARVADPLWRLYFSRSFARAMDRHVHTEFALLRDLLRRDRIDAPPAPTSVHSARDEDGP